MEMPSPCRNWLITSSIAVLFFILRQVIVRHLAQDKKSSDCAMIFVLTRANCWVRISGVIRHQHLDEVLVRQGYTRAIPCGVRTFSP